MARDYILRLIEQVAAALAGVASRRRTGSISEARDEIERLCLQTIGLTPAALRGLSPDAVTQLLERSGGTRAMRGLLLAGLLEQEDDLAGPDRPPAERLAATVHCVCLLADALPLLAAEDRADCRRQLERHIAGLGPLRDHPALRDRLARAG